MNNPSPFKVYFKLDSNFVLNDPSEVMALTYDEENEDWNQNFVKDICISKNFENETRFLVLSVLKTTPIVLAIDKFIGILFFNIKQIFLYFESCIYNKI